MMATGQEDLRVQRTKEAIRHAFTEMICEMDFEKISIKELTERARINRKTFYLHYDSLDDLLRELQNEMGQSFIQRTAHLKRPMDMDKVTREFFLTNEELGKLGERLVCSGNYHYINRRMVNSVMDHTWDEYDENPYVKSIVMTYIAQSTLAVYKQWIADGKKIPLEEIIEITTKLVCRGIDGFSEK